MMSLSATPVSQPVKPERSSNLELYRILCMLAIVAHHYVVNSGLMWSPESPITQNPTSVKTIFLLLFGMWGKTGINCFMMITGYFMCKSHITLQKFIKLLLEVYFYKVIIYLVFLVAGREDLSLFRIAQIVMPVWDIADNFVDCFLIFFLTIPFWTILVNNISRRQHQLLLLLVIGCFTIMGSMPHFIVRFNYVLWFGVIFLIASYFRLYPSDWSENRTLWGWASAASIVLAMSSVVFMQLKIARTPFFFVADSNRVLAVAVAITTFNYFRLLPLKNVKAINYIASSTFAVLLIHSNSNVMRRWLWQDIVDCVGMYQLSIANLVMYCFLVTFLIFISCVLIDKVRIYCIEKPILGKHLR